MYTLHGVPARWPCSSATRQEKWTKNCCFSFLWNVTCDNIICTAVQSQDILTFKILRFGDKLLNCRLFLVFLKSKRWTIEFPRNTVLWRNAWGRIIHFKNTADLDRDVDVSSAYNKNICFSTSISYSIRSPFSSSLTSFSSVPFGRGTRAIFIFIYNNISS